MEPRQVRLRAWLQTQLGIEEPELVPASQDASFRRYFRVAARAAREDGSLIVMDAPPEQESTEPFLAIAAHLAGIGVHVPDVVAADPEDGFVLMEDLGDTDYLSALCGGAEPEALYADAFEALLKMQVSGSRDTGFIPDYDRRLLRSEVELFRDWLLGRHLDRDPGPDHERIEALLEDLLPAIEEQPKVFVHRDYHSRNLMDCREGPGRNPAVNPGENPGVLDFQDAVVGPVSYDLVSLLKDCYIAWPRGKVEAWVADYHARGVAAGAPVGDDAGVLLDWVDRMGVQRHLKAAGIFCRLWYRDGKAGYLEDVARTLGHVVELGREREDFRALATWLAEEVLPELPAANHRAIEGAR